MKFNRKSIILSSKQRNIFYILLCILFFTVAFSSGIQAQSMNEEDKETLDNLIYNDAEAALKYALKKQETITKGTKAEVEILNYIGMATYYLDRYDTAYMVTDSAMVLSEKLGYTEGKAQALFNKGDISILEGKYSSALDYLMESLELFGNVSDSSGMADCLNGIGIIYTEQENYEKGLEYFTRALKYGDDIKVGDSYSNMADLYLRMEAWDNAKLYAEKAFSKGQENEDAYVISTSLDVLGHVYAYRGDVAKSTDYFRQALKIKSELEDMQGMAATMIMVGTNLKAEKQSDSALYYFYNAFQLSASIGAKEEIRNSASELARMLATEGVYDSAFFYQNKFIEVNEEIANERASKKIAEMEAGIEAEKKEKQIALLESEKKHQAETQRLYIWAGIIILALFLLAIGMMYNRYMTKKKANEELEAKNHEITKQKEIIEEKNNDITGSIRYAKRIQQAILPPARFIEEALPGAFILYLPKDIVAGDFYWVETIIDTSSGNSEKKVIFAAADCTGHGVPGAMVSVVCHNALNRSVREFNLIDPGQILDKTRELILEQFIKSEEDVKDGMDIALCTLNLQTREMYFAGANNPLWIMRKETGEFEEIKPTKQAVGKVYDPRPFLSHRVELQPGDIIYIFTDGFADQFGGEKGKKFKYKPFRELLVANCNKPAEEQKEALQNALKEWTSYIDPDHNENFEQVDDITVLGYKV